MQRPSLQPPNFQSPDQKSDQKPNEMSTALLPLYKEGKAYSVIKREGHSRNGVCF